MSRRAISFSPAASSLSPLSPCSFGAPARSPTRRAGAALGKLGGLAFAASVAACSAEAPPIVAEDPPAEAPPAEAPPAQAPPPAATPPTVPGTRLTATAAPAPSSQPAFGYAAIAVGGGQYAVTDSPIATPRDVTMEAWVRWSGGTQAQYIVYNGEFGLDGYGMYIENGTLRVRVTAGGPGGLIFCNSCSVPTNTWAHLSATFDGTNWQLAVNGVAGASTYYGGRTFNAPTNQLAVGAVVGTGRAAYNFSGQLDEVRLWSDALSSAELAAQRNAILFGDEPDLAAYYRLDEGGGVTAADSAGDQPLALQGATWTSSTAPLTYGLARNAFGAGALTARAASPVSTAIDNFTFEAWVRWDGSNTQQTIFYNGDSARDGYGLVLLKGSPAISVGGKGSFVCRSCRMIPGAWTHLAVVRESGLWKIYQDNRVEQSANPPAPNPPSANFFVASNYPNGEYFAGALDELRVWTVARSAAELDSAAAISLASSTPNLAHYYRFDESSGNVASDSSGALPLQMNGNSAWTLSAAPLTSATR